LGVGVGCQQDTIFTDLLIVGRRVRSLLVVVDHGACVGGGVALVTSKDKIQYPKHACPDGDGRISDSRRLKSDYITIDVLSRVGRSVVLHRDNDAQAGSRIEAAPKVI
jgi:hypothetical protein